MILVDTSVWIDHLRKTDHKLHELLHKGEVCIHPFIIGEIACGNLTNREEILQLLKALPEVSAATNDEVFEFIENWRLHGGGPGFIDMHLLASSFIDKASFWTKDKRLSTAYSELNFNKNIF